jgi:hypothetical protein
MPPRQPTQLGFVLLGMALAVPAFVSGALLAIEWPGSGPLARLALGAVAGLSLVAIEALWWVRPWVRRAVDAWAVACVAAVLAADLVLVDGSTLPVLYLTGAFVVVPCATISGYVRSRARTLGLAP